MLRRARAAAGGSLDGLARPDETVAHWVARHGQHEELRTMLWEPLALAALNEDPAVAAAPPFVRVLSRMVAADAQDAALAVPVKPLVALYCEPARRRIEAAGGRIRTHSLARVRLDGDRLAGVEVRDGGRPEHAVHLDADAVVVAVAWFDLPRLFVDERPDHATHALAHVCRAAARTAASPIVSVNLWFDRPVLPCAFLGLPGRSLHWAFDKRVVLGGEASHVTLIGSGASELVRRSNEALAAIAVEELRDALPSARRASLRRTLVVREPRATFSVAPGQPSRPAAVTAVPNLVLAGDWVDTGLPATIEGACASGRRAAEAVRRVLGMR